MATGHSLESFWINTQGTGQRGFRKEEDYTNFLLWMADIPRFYDENIANMRAGLARGFIPSRAASANNYYQSMTSRRFIIRFRC